MKIFLDCIGASIKKDIDVSNPNQQAKVLIIGKREKQIIKMICRKFRSREFVLKIIIKKKNDNIKKVCEIKDSINGYYEIRLENLKDETNF